MATSKTTTQSRRLNLALQATWEVECLLAAMLERMGPENVDLATRGMCIRAQQLALSIMDAFDEHGTEFAELHVAVHGSTLSAKEVAHG